MNITFADFFKISREDLRSFGAYNIPLVHDVPLFIDPFLLFNSKNSEYQRLHAEILTYVSYLKSRSVGDTLTDGLIKALYRFPEVPQNWLGFTQKSNKGRGLGKTFANSLNSNFRTLLKNFGEEEITASSHLEKLTLIKSGVGRDAISDFTTNLIKHYLCEFTQRFTLLHVPAKNRKVFMVDHCGFNYTTGSWRSCEYTLPNFNGDFVLLTPRNILTRDHNWINRPDLVRDFREIQRSIDNDALRDSISDYFERILPKNPNQEEYTDAVEAVLKNFPDLLDYYIRFKEERGDQAEKRSVEVVDRTESFVDKVAHDLAELLQDATAFYTTESNSLGACRKRALFLKHVIEDKDGYRIFNRGQVKREEDVQLLFKFTWFASPFDINSEVNNGRGPADFKASLGSADASLVEFKLASNSKLKQNLQNQSPIYERASDAKATIKVIVFFSSLEEKRVCNILKSLKLEDDNNIILIDARSDNKPSASNAM